jgi:hypothetical protein
MRQVAAAIGASVRRRSTQVGLAVGLVVALVLVAAAQSLAVDVPSVATLPFLGVAGGFAIAVSRYRRGVIEPGQPGQHLTRKARTFLPMSVLPVVLAMAVVVGVVGLFPDIADAAMQLPGEIWQSDAVGPVLGIVFALIALLLLIVALVFLLVGALAVAGFLLVVGLVVVCFGFGYAVGLLVAEAVVDGPGTAGPQ